MSQRLAFIVVGELLLGPKRFVDIQGDIPGIAPAPLFQWLQDLEDAGIVMRRTLPDPAKVVVYDLTDWGYGVVLRADLLGPITEQTNARRVVQRPECACPANPAKR